MFLRLRFLGLLIASLIAAPTTAATVDYAVAINGVSGLAFPDLQPGWHELTVSARVTDNPLVGSSGSGGLLQSAFEMWEFGDDSVTFEERPPLQPWMEPTAVWDSTGLVPDFTTRFSGTLFGRPADDTRWTSEFFGETSAGLPPFFPIVSSHGAESYVDVVSGRFHWDGAPTALEITTDPRSLLVGDIQANAGAKSPDVANGVQFTLGDFVSPAEGIGTAAPLPPEPDPDPDPDPERRPSPVVNYEIRLGDINPLEILIGGDYDIELWAKVTDNELAPGVHGGLLRYSVDIGPDRAGSMEFLDGSTRLGRWDSRAAKPGVFRITSQGVLDDQGRVVGESGAVPPENYDASFASVAANEWTLLATGPASIEYWTFVSRIDVFADPSEQWVYGSLGGGAFGAVPATRVVSFFAGELLIPEPSTATLGAAWAALTIAFPRQFLRRR